MNYTLQSSERTFQQTTAIKSDASDRLKRATLSDDPGEFRAASIAFDQAEAAVRKTLSDLDQAVRGVIWVAR